MAPSSAIEPIATPADSAELATSAPDLLLPNTPRASHDDSVGVVPSRPVMPPSASHTQEIIEPGQDAPFLSSGDKVLLGLRSSFTPFSALGWIATAGYEQLLNGSPNYGTDRGAFGQRLGASFLRSTSENIFSESVLAPILHEDPRYYVLGPTHSIPARILYAVTRPLINRTDSGRNAPNFALLGGNFAGAELTYAYYPQPNRNQSEILSTFGGSLGGSALGYVLHEFCDDLTHRFHNR